jgi:ABC-type lipoprotein release transport system permease subunit
MIRHLKILEYALSSLWRRRHKSAAIVLVYAFTIAVLGSVLLLTEALRTEASRLLAAAPELIVQNLRAGRHELIPIDYAERIRAIPGVSSVRPRTWGYYYDALTGANYTLLGLAEEPEDLTLVAGRFPSSPGEIAIGAGVARARQAEAGDEMVLGDGGSDGAAFTVVGVFRAEADLLTHDLVVFREEELRAFFAFPSDRATDIAVQVHNPQEVETVAGKIKSLFPDSRPITRTEMARTYDAVFNWRSGILLTLFASALIAFCILAWDKATGVSAEERREIGILKAVGWETGDILELKFWEGAAVSLSAFLLGLTAAMLHVFHGGAALLRPVLQGWSVLFPPLRPVPTIDLYQIFILGFLTVAPYVACTVVPSWKAAVTDPDSVMRG